MQAASDREYQMLKEVLNDARETESGREIAYQQQTWLHLRRAPIQRDPCLRKKFTTTIKGRLCSRFRSCNRKANFSSCSYGWIINDEGP